MIKKLFLITCCLSLLLFSSCKENTAAVDSSIVPAEASVALFEQGITVGEDGGALSLQFAASDEWMATLPSDAAWVLLNPRNGKAGNAVLALTINPNPTGVQRTTKLTLKCGEVSVDINITQTVGIPDGFSFSPLNPDADQPLTITFKANSSSPLFGYKGDVYLHAGVISEGEWMYVPAEWTQNIDKCKMSLVDTNVWTITLSPSIRQWFNSGTTPVRKLGLVVRSANGALKGVNEDTFVAVNDSKMKGFEPAAIIPAALPTGVEEGINVLNASTITFVLYDKDKNGSSYDYAYILGDFNNWTLANDATSQMKRDEAKGCWWITVSGLEPAKEYAFQYYLGKKGGDPIRVADPYAEKVLDPDNDRYIPSSTYPNPTPYPTGAKGIVSVVRTQRSVYDWRVKNFTPASKENLLIYELLLRDFTKSGDLNGAMQKLDYIKSLGFNAVELMPVQEFDGNDSWGYNPCFYFAIDKAYGTPDMMKAFVDACHEKGLAVILDVVYNHATGSMPFAKLWWNAAANKTASNNPYFNVDAPHPFSVYHDFNHENPLVRRFVKRNLAFLLKEYHVDGFRFDLAKGFTQKQSADDNVFRTYDESRVAILKDYHDAITATDPNALMILELFADDREEKVYADAGLKVWRNANNAFSQAAMGFVQNSNFEYLYRSSTNMPCVAYVGYMESHDEERMAFKAKNYGVASVKNSLSTRINQLATAATFGLMVPGPKMVWQFGEMGYDVSIDEGGRTGRKPLHWEYATDGTRKFLLDTYTNLLNLRKQHASLFSAGVSIVSQMNDAEWTSGRWMKLTSVDGKTLYVMGNFTDNAITMTLPTGTWTKLGDTSAVSGSISLPAHTAFVYLKN